MADYLTETTDTSNGFVFGGDGTLISEAPLAALTDTEPVRILAISTPPTVMSGGQPA